MDFETLKQIIIDSIDESKTLYDLLQIVINKVYKRGIEDAKE